MNRYRTEWRDLFGEWQFGRGYRWRWTATREVGRRVVDWLSVREWRVIDTAKDDRVVLYVQRHRIPAIPTTEAPHE